MEYPRVVIKSIQGSTAVSCGLDVIPLDIETVRMKIKEIYHDTKICASRHKAVEQILREEFLMYAVNNGLIESYVSLDKIPYNYRKLLKDRPEYDEIKLTYETE